jgi:hypothetical protein
MWILWTLLYLVVRQQHGERAIVAGREALTTGLIKRVGDGTHIGTWEDRWIPSTLMMKPMGRQGSCPLEKVSDLINVGTGTWKVDVVRNNFLALDADGVEPREDSHILC